MRDKADTEFNKRCIATNLRNAIKKSGITQIEFASRIDVQQSNMYRYLHGIQCPSMDTFIRMCQALDCSADYLLGFSPFVERRKV